MFCLKSNLRAALLLLAVVASAGFAAPPPTVEQTLQFKPVQPGIDYEKPPADELAKCRVEAAAGNTGWVVYGAGGQTLRKFLDTDADGTVDTRKFYNLGMEIYRDIDSNKDNKIDQSRWVNIGGTKWGIDRNQDGKIDEWRIISADEAALEAVSALVSNDPARLSAVMLTPADARSLGLSATLSKEIAEETADVGTKIRTVLTKTKVLNRTSRWLRFDPQSPSIVPKDEGKANQDLMILGNPMALIKTGEKDGIVQLGEMVRVGNTWKLTAMPTPIEGNDTVVGSGRIMKPGEAAPAEGGMAYSKEVQVFLRELGKWDEQGPGSTPAEKARYQNGRGQILQKLIAASKTPEEREQWVRQMADGLALAVQSGGFPAGLERLKAMESEQYKADRTSKLVPYITYRRISADYSLRLQTANNDKRQEAQKWYSDQLEGYWKAYPNAEDTPDVLFQLALGNEYQNNVAESKKWYGQLVRQFGKTANGRKANGALKRLTMEGKPFAMSGPAIEGGKLDIAAYKGRVTLVVYWATWCTPCTADMPLLIALYDTYKKNGFEVMGINMDPKGSEAKISAYKKKYKIAFNSLSEPDGLDGPLGLSYGIVSAPTMFLIGKDGRVLRRSVSITDLKRELPDFLK